MRSTFVALILTTQVLWAQNKTENVIIITLDGYRWQELFTGADLQLVANDKYVGDTTALKKNFWKDTPEQRRQTLMPFFWNVIAMKGQLYGNRQYNNKVNCSNHMWFSYPGYNEILTGFADDERINSNDKFENPNVTLLEWLNRQPAFKGKVAAFGSWDVFPFIINEKRSGVPVNAGFEPATGKLTDRERLLNEMQLQIPSPFEGVRLDGLTHQYAMEYVKKNQPRVVYISYGETDDFAHEGKYDAYLHSAQVTDSFIRDWWNYLQANPKYKGKTTIIVTTDHGRGVDPIDTWRSHGTEIANADQIWFAVIGPDTPATGEMKTEGQWYQNQVAATVSAMLGMNYTNDKKVGDAVMAMIKH